MGLLCVNGSGKTTLINTILNLYEKDSEIVKINGFSMETNEKEAKNEICFVLGENMFEVPLKKKVAKLFTGLKVRFQLAFALSHYAKLFIMDEPAAGLDPLFRKKLINCMQEIVEDGSRSIIFSTHIIEDLDQIGDYITLLHNGKILFSLSKEELQDKYRILNSTKNQIEDIKCSNIIYREYGKYHNCAFIENIQGNDYLGTEIKIPILEDIMYYLQKGGYF